jgi:antitoxin (DNA-binding transcriptional repressor) of toxin-antitoxin stability system
MSPSIPVEQAQANLKELIGKLAPGEEIIITDDERPVAMLVAPPPDSRQTSPAWDPQGHRAVHGP